MIIGLGNDITDAKRIAKTLKQFGTKFEQRVFTPDELSYADTKQGDLRVRALAKRFAAKEAALKALGTGMAAGIEWHNVEIIRAANGRPSIEWHGRAREYLLARMPLGMEPYTHLSMTDEGDIASAVVIIEARTA